MVTGIEIAVTEVIVMLQVVGYLRVSTDGQVGEDKFGLSAQREQIESYAKAQQMDIVDWYTDEGITGATLEREGLQQLLKDSSSGTFKAVIVAKMDRVARDLMAQLWIEKELLTNDIELVSASEPFRGQDAANVLFRQVIGAFAQFEKSRIAERMTGGRKQKAKRGGYAGGGVALGYKAQHGGKALEVDYKKAATVKRIFELRQKHSEWRLQDIAEQLNQEGHTTATGAKFSKVQVKRVLDRETLYAGGYEYGGIKTAQGQQQALI